MTKIIITIIAVYVLYYAGNIIYDLFLKKDASIKTVETDEYSLAEFAQTDKEPTKDIGIEDVENLNTPNSFNKKELATISEDETDMSHNLEHWRKKFESEQNIDSFDNDNDTEIQEKIKEQQIISNSQKEENIQVKENDNHHFSKRKSYQEQFHKILNLAETSVQLISDHDGYKTYQSAI